MLTCGQHGAGFRMRIPVESGSATETRKQGVSNLGRLRAARARRRGGDGEICSACSATPKINGRKLTEGEIFYNGFQYIIGGLETTRNAISADSSR